MKKTCLTAIFLTFLLSACSPAPAPAATVTAEASNTPIPSTTPTPAATRTPEPTEKPAVALEEPQDVPQAGFSFRNPSWHTYSIKGPYVFISGNDPALTIALVGNIPNTDNLSEEAVVDEYLNSLFSQMGGNYEKSNPRAVSIGGIEGSTFDIAGEISGQAFQGEAVAVKPAGGIAFFSFGYAVTENDENAWVSGGVDIFHAVIGSITFLAPGQAQSGSCPISTDSTYGYTMENAIKVGGGDFGGPARERAYLDNLLGPDGKAVTYERGGSLDFGGTILDEYSVRVAGKIVTLYIDEYAWSQPMAPVGFQCGGPFPLSEP